MYTANLNVGTFHLRAEGDEWQTQENIATNWQQFLPIYGFERVTYIWVAANFGYLFADLHF